MTHNTRAKQYQKYGEGSHMVSPLFVHPDIFLVKRGAQTAASFSMSSSDNVPRSSRRDQPSPRGVLEFSSLACEKPLSLATAGSPTQLQSNDVGLRARAFQKETSALALGGGIAAGSKTTRNKLPRSPLLTSSMRPPFASTAQRAMARPSPTPPSSLERPVSTR